MKFKTAISILIICLSSLAGYSFGCYRANMKTSAQYENINEWGKLPVYVRENLAQSALNFVNWKNVSKEEARKVLTLVLDASQVPNGDLAVPSEVVHSKRYIISQWQRSAVGATVMIIAKDKDEDFCVALGAQRGTLRHPQGYMETALPKEDLTGLHAKNSSRLNFKTGEPVQIDETIEDNAVREIFEEIGLKVAKDQLELLSISSNMNASPVTIAVHYLVKLDSTPTLQTNDEEFADDDLAKPMWVKIKDIKKVKDNQYMTSQSSLPVDLKTIEILNQALVKLKMKQV